MASLPAAAESTAPPNNNRRRSRPRRIDPIDLTRVQVHGIITVVSTSRRTVVGGALGALGSAALAGCSNESDGGRPLAVETRAPVPSAASGPRKRPNLLVVLTDDQRWDHLSASPSAPAYLSTPALDRLAAAGTRFENAFVTTALCSPSRASILTGLYATRHGVQNNLTAWNPVQRTMFEPLAEQGYRCGFIGKWHMPGGIPDLRGVNRFVTFTAQGGQGQYVDCPLLIDGVPTARPDSYITEDLTTLALDWIGAQPTTDPWCLFLGHKAVHHEFQPPKHLEGAMDDIDLSGMPQEAFAFMTTLDRNVWEGTVQGLERMYRRYLETLLGLDEQMERLLAAIDLSTTAVVFTSDNGYSWGEHVLSGKRWAYEENTRVPMLVAGPGLAAGQVRDELVLGIDIAPTLLDLAGVEWGDGAVPQGRSMTTLLGRPDPGGAPWRSDFMYEYFLDFPYNVPGIQAVRTESWLWMEFDSADEPELYDVVADPRTQRNLRAVQPEVGAQLAQRLRELGETVRAGGPV